MSWHDLVSFTVSPWELFVRGTVMYWFLLLIFRFLMRRDVGAVGMADVLLTRADRRCGAERDGRRL